MKSVITGIFFPTLRMTDFTQAERLNIRKGKSFVSNTPVSSESFNFRAYDIADKLSIPFYVFAGKYDLTTDYAVQKSIMSLCRRT